MPKRQRITRFRSDKVQGEGSWALIAGLTVREMREAREAANAADFDAFEMGVSLIASHVREWNWVDDDGEPMSQPKDWPKIVDELSDAEVAFLGDCIRGSEDEAKN